MRSTASSSRSFPRSFALITGALLTAATLAGCKQDIGPGSVVVSYVLGNNKTCAEIEVTNIEVKLFRGTFEEPEVEYTELVPCDGSGEVVIDGIVPDSYEIRVIGKDANDVAILDNLGQTSAERRVEVFDDAESTIDVDLTARPAELWVRWALGMGGFSNCGGVGIDRFQITAYETGGAQVMLETEIDCEEAGDETTGYRLVEDPDRELNGARLGEVGIRAIGADGSQIGAPAAFIFDPPGAGYPVELGIECTNVGCIPE
jgi:hypothetical protein